MATGQELNYNTGASALDMALEIFGEGTVVVDATYSGWSQSSAIYSGGDSIAPGATPSDSGVILSTGRATNYTQSSGDPNRSGATSTNTSGPNNDAQLNAAAGTSTFDAAILEVDFIPTGNVMSLQFQFASEEYPEFTGSTFNDIFAIWMNGTLVTSPVFNVTQVNTVNAASNPNLFQDNTGDDFNTEMDGITVTLSVTMPVNVGEVNTLRIGIADVADSNYDSNILIAAGSAQTALIAQDDAITHFEGQTVTLDVLANDGTGGIMSVTHINGQPIATNGTVTLNSGHVITLLANGNLQIAPPAGQSGLAGPETVNFSYTVEDASGITDTAFVVVTAVPCFARGTMIRTPDGEKPVEALAPGDMVETRDCGPQPLRWVGARRVAATGRFAPVVIEAGTFGFHRRLVVSPQHRILLTHWMAELMFGEDEVLVAAKDLVNGCSVRIVEGGEVEYFHLLFDRHQIVWSDGLETESFLPGPCVMNEFEHEVREEVLALFPEIDPDSYEGYGPSARPALRAYEARTLASRG
ncbi:choice-of-anchor L domain-containing protein [Roseibacterium sp. SDUM158016]|uniref:Hint domain-containing protein n=1 Tax=Roseicyclus sediminis TaxID=2980997 RepID=UPI0021CE0C1F|nr:Hint domain-containing protein [Roseibacterium sp. SDUM158016]MCU4651687.1 choice-of-anchor L domain-containing protein [Roseibacterium sp. SDUM158016]